MIYHLHHQGRSLGTATLAELHARRRTGQLSGEELVWCEGMTGWQPLDQVLGPLPPPLPTNRTPSMVARWLIGSTILASVILISLGGFFFVRLFERLRTLRASKERVVYRQERQRPDAALRPIIASTNSATEETVRRRAREFRIRQWLDGYKERGDRNHAMDGEVVEMIETWIESNYGSPGGNARDARSLAQKIVNGSVVEDPLVWAVTAAVGAGNRENMVRLDRALAGFDGSRHRAYPKLYAAITLLEGANYSADRSSLVSYAMRRLEECFRDGSFRPEDQAEIAEIFIDGWGDGFASRSRGAVARIARGAGSEFSWLANVLEGEFHYGQAWRARGGGYADTVSEAGWKEFNKRLGAARTNFTRAWKEDPGLPLAPARMIRVAMADSGVAEMRLWFDRTLAVQLDYPRAWSDMRWGLRPRWHGNNESILTFGKLAIETGRYDTDVPYKFMDAVTDLEGEMQLPAGLHIYGRSDVWPNLERMYEGYVAHSEGKPRQDGWRSSYAAAAYCAGRFDIARRQLDAIQWRMWQTSLGGWGRDLSLMPLEVAARTGPLASRTTEAESFAERNDVAAALKIYEAIKDSPDADERTARFITHRCAVLQQERKLQAGEWSSLLPAIEEDPAWHFVAGKAHPKADGSVAMEPGTYGYMLVSRARLGDEFEVRGEFEVDTPEGPVETGIGFGFPTWQDSVWYKFSVRRSETNVTARLARGWSTSSIAGEVTLLRPGRNEIQVRYHDHHVTAFVNDRQVVRAVEIPENQRIHVANFAVALIGTGEQGVGVSYRSLQARKLPQE